jgi:putative spermidine/putrescine transport system substrate-binding protein
MNKISSGLAVLALIASALSGAPAKAQSEVKQLVMVEGGGDAGKALEQGYIVPFTKSTGIAIRRNTSAGGEAGQIKAMAASGRFDVQIFEVQPAVLIQNPELFEPLDWAAIDPPAMAPDAKSPISMGFSYYSWVMAWKKGAKPLTSWADFFDVEKFPGRRALRANSPLVQLELALLADGVPQDKLYPLDHARAFRFLEKNASKISIWWTTGSQALQALRSGEVDYTMIWSGRVSEDPQLELTFNQGFLSLSHFAVPKGVTAPEKAAVMKFLHEVSLPQNQAKTAELIAYTGPSPDIGKFLPAERLKVLPTSPQNRKLQALVDEQWWAANRTEMDRLWNEFKVNYVR